ncbi:Thioredoxin family protein [Tritrichomonas foetus]|uniref:protein disulfide-isomerase n=1 Tax=Tritrichomonas foetus TaxID=1144522 RepID=A0A1J4KNR7_9EUKA|nr:Thioredoxin family protein [Tritrichomonas foetus]|eukprot:OHT11342.1 Thioredoxin family protein [Tritrichomonas foetus]
MAEAFAEAATAFKDVAFAGVDCTKESSICSRYKVNGYPTVFIFKAGSKDPITEYKGSRSVDDFCDFVENHTEFHAKRPKKILPELNPVTFDDFVNNRKCTFVTFFAPWCGHCKRFLPEAKKAAEAFNLHEPNASVAVMNCDMYRSYCQRFEIRGFPTIKLFKDGNPIPYSSERTAESVANFINSNCGTFRAADGSVTEQAGIIPQASALAQGFVAAEAAAREDTLAKVKQINGADFYVQAMERIIKNGAPKVRADLEVMKKLLAQKSASPNTLDELKKRINVLEAFKL